MRSPVLLSKKIIEELQSCAVNTLHSPDSVRFPSLSMFEPPCSIKWLRAEHSFEMGAFSYAVSGYFFACTIGRYCSLGEQVQVGRHSHPLDFVSTSPIFYRQAIDVLGVGKHSSLNNKPSRPSREPTALKQTVIGHDVYIGHGAFLLPGIVVGHGAVIGACSVVTKDVPPYAVVAGSPATIKRYRFDSLTVQNLLVSKWWNYAPSDLGDLDPAFPNDYIERVALLQSQGRAKYAPAKIILGDFAQTASRSF